MAKESTLLPAIIENDKYVEVWDDIRLVDPETFETVDADHPSGCEDRDDGSSGTPSPAPTRRPRFGTPSLQPRRRKQFCMGALVSLVLLLGCTGLTVGLAKRGNATASKIVAAVPGTSAIPGLGGHDDDKGPCSAARKLMRLQVEAETQSVRGARADPCPGDNEQDGATTEVPTYSPTSWPTYSPSEAEAEWPTYSPSEAEVEDLGTKSPTVVEVAGLVTSLPTKTDIIKSPTAAPIPSIVPTEEESMQEDEVEEEEEEDMDTTVATTTVAPPDDEAQTTSEAPSTPSPSEETTQQETLPPTTSPPTFDNTAVPTETEADDVDEEGCPEPYEAETVYPPDSLVSVSGTVYQVRA